MNNQLILSNEQQYFVKQALQGHNILVDACIGSGKTTAIQHLCDQYDPSVKILYLTYNKLLKLDAKSKIKNRNVIVTNYHGYAYMCLSRIGVRVGLNDMIQTYNRLHPDKSHYDVLIIDEYQDIEQELADMLEIIKNANPGLQIIAVGDMQQKIYDKTTLNIEQFINEFLGDKVVLEFTQCFRLSKDHAAMLGKVWHKTIIGVNDNCKIETMSVDEVCDFLAEQDPRDVLCLGARTGDLNATLNLLESSHPEKFNKNTIYASIKERDSSEGNANPGPENGIFTTFDSSKGLERKICVVFDFVPSYWTVRAGKPGQKYEILRNIFCVAASRGKERIIFVKKDEEILSEDILSASTTPKYELEDMNISEMFDFKYKEDIEHCFSLINTKQIPAPETDTDFGTIDVKTTDGLIDLSPCIGTYQEQAFFENYDLEKDFSIILDTDPDRAKIYEREFYTSSTQRKLLILTAMQTKLNRYMNQVDMPFVSDTDTIKIKDRLSLVFTPYDETQVKSFITFKYGRNLTFDAIGLADVVKDNVVYELKFVSALSHEHFLQCACYICSLGLEKGVLWNTRTNEMYEITIPNKTAFLNAVADTITKGEYGAYWRKADKPKSKKQSKPKKKKSA